MIKQSRCRRRRRRQSFDFQAVSMLPDYTGRNQRTQSEMKPLCLPTIAEQSCSKFEKKVVETVREVLDQWKTFGAFVETQKSVCACTTDLRH